MAILERIKKATGISDLLDRFRKKRALSISDYVNFRSIGFLKSKNRNDAILELINLLERNGTLKDKKAFYKAILEREKIVSTGIGMGVAIPHAKLKSFDDFFISIGIQRFNPIDWKSIDKFPVRIIFLIGGPETRQNEYLQLLSKLTAAIKDEYLRKSLLRLDNTQAIAKLFNRF